MRHRAASPSADAIPSMHRSIHQGEYSCQGISWVIDSRSRDLGQAFRPGGHAARDGGLHCGPVAAFEPGQLREQECRDDQAGRHQCERPVDAQLVGERAEEERGRAETERGGEGAA